MVTAVKTFCPWPLGFYCTVLRSIRGRECFNWCCFGLQTIECKKALCDCVWTEIVGLCSVTRQKSGERVYFSNPASFYTRDKILIFISLLCPWDLHFLSESSFPYIVHETNVELKRLKICTPVAGSVHSTKYIHSKAPSISETYPVFFPLSPDF